MFDRQLFFYPLYHIGSVVYCALICTLQLAYQKNTMNKPNSEKIGIILTLIFCAVAFFALWLVLNNKPSPSPEPAEIPAQTASTSISEPEPATVAAKPVPAVPKTPAKPGQLPTCSAQTQNQLSAECVWTAYVTSYTWWDNTPPGSPIIAFSSADGAPTVHNIAGGIGTYQNPITVAVGHVIENGVDTPDYLPGTRFYVEDFKAYFMVEDTCGDGNTPQDMPCHNLKTADPGAEVWLDIWIDGRDVSVEDSNSCARKLTRNYRVIQNPSPSYPVVEGSFIKDGKCRAD